MKWRALALGELTVKIGSGATPQGGSASYKTFGIPLVRSMNVHDGVFKPAGLVFLDDVQAKQLDHVTLELNDVLLNITGASVARACRLPARYAGGRVNQHVAIIRPRPDKLHPDYLAHCLISPRMKLELLRIAGSSGATRQALTKADIEQFEIPLPPLEEQRKIAAVLNLAYDLRQKRRNALRRLQGIDRALFLEMFGNPVTNNFKWPTARLADLGSLDRGVSKHRPRNDPALLGGPYPLIQTGEVTNSDGYIREFTDTYSELGLRQSKLWPKGTLCITIAANIGNTGILTFDACFPDSVVGFVPAQGTRTEFVQQLLAFSQPVLERAAPQFAQKNINLAILRELIVIRPPHDLQASFAERVAEVDKLKTRHRAHLVKLDALFASLQHRAFRGEL